MVLVLQVCHKIFSRFYTDFIIQKDRAITILEKHHKRFYSLFKALYISNLLVSALVNLETFDEIQATLEALAASSDKNQCFT